MDADILQAIQIIDAKIASLQQARDTLAGAFGIGSNRVENATAHPVAPNAHAAAPVAVYNGTSRVSSRSEPGGRKVELATFLLKHGPMSRVQIIEKSGIPEGTVSYCLSDKRFFEQQETGDWFITDFSQRGLRQKEATGTFKGEHD